MKKTIALLSLALLLTPTYSTASVPLGKKIYQKKFYKKCGFSGAEFARNHTQAEWEEIYLSGNLPQEAQMICPKLDTTLLETEKWKNIYQYVTKYASDGVIPNGCSD